ncbi:hypothetical protein TNCT_79841 [Trichonephila clavata]|uniref:Uncharacterized protein n=1 Tax=Trichonephila clavata TaxID=2740835 RepID=A0A8X6KDS4_TRICU|nr:hypothetical protein TNCT_79841 [Trichonephila clavata]
MHSISSKYRKPKGRPSKRRAACIRNLEKGKSACSSSSDSKYDEISSGAVPSTTEITPKQVIKESSCILRSLKEFSSKKVLGNATLYVCHHGSYVSAIQSLE